MNPDAERSPTPRLKEPKTTAPSQQMAAETAQPPQAPGYPPAFSGASGATWVIRDLASI